MTGRRAVQERVRMFISARVLGAVGTGLLGASVIGSAVSPARAATPQQIETAINKGVEFLYKQQNQDGNWEETDARPTLAQMEEDGNQHLATGGQYSGRTALVTYALLACGEGSTEPRIEKAADFLRGFNAYGHYALGLRAQVWLNLPPNKQNVAAMTRDAKLLRAGLSNKPINMGLYTYVPGMDLVDMSCSQYGVLGTWAAEQVLDNVPVAYWQQVENAWRSHQQDGGGWNYRGTPVDIQFFPADIQMTAAGLATLFITQEYVHRNDGINGGGNIVDPHIEKGMAFMLGHVKDAVNADGGSTNRPYALYGIERVGLASGYKYFGDVNWYDTGADTLIKLQDEKGSWSMAQGDVIDTCFCLLFLSRGRNPVMVNKIQYKLADGSVGHWNQRPRDMANATHWVGREAERDLNWQTIDLSVGTVKDLHDSQILYLAGDQALDLPDADKAKIRQYVEQGGMVIGNSDTGSDAFNTSFKRLAAELFPGHAFVDMPSDHPMYRDEQFPATSWPSPPKLEMMSNGARVLFLLAPDDALGKPLQRGVDKKQTMPFELMANAFLYSVDKKSAQFRGQTYVVEPDAEAKTTKTVHVARIQHEGNWNPEPGAWKRMSAIVRNQDQIKLDVKDVNPDATTPDAGSLEGVNLAHLTGTGELKLSVGERTALQKFVSNGGILLVDAAGGDEAFATSAKAELMTMFPSEAKELDEPLPPNYALTRIGKEKLKPDYRTFALLKLGASAGQFNFRIMKHGGHTAVIYSPQDLTVGMVGQPVGGIVGYTPEVATGIVRSLVRNVAALRPADAKTPAPAATTP